jgi:hypothetical protein
MKTFRIATTLIICLALVFSVTSCVVLVGKDNGRHEGWHKNSNNPHHPHSTNPGKSKFYK